MHQGILSITTCDPSETPTGLENGMDLVAINCQPPLMRRSKNSDKWGGKADIVIKYPESDRKF